MINVFNSNYEEIGSLDKNLVLHTLGKVKIRYGRKYIDILNDKGELNVKIPDVINSAKDKDSIKSNGFYMLDGELYLYYNGDLIQLTGGEDSELTFVKYDSKLELTLEQLNNAQYNIGLKFNSLDDAKNYVTEGIVHIGDKIYYINGDRTIELTLKYPLKDINNAGLSRYPEYNNSAIVYTNDEWMYVQIASLLDLLNLENTLNNKINNLDFNAELNAKLFDPLQYSSVYNINHIGTYKEDNSNKLFIETIPSLTINNGDICTITAIAVEAKVFPNLDDHGTSINLMFPKEYGANGQETTFDNSTYKYSELGVYKQKALPIELKYLGENQFEFVGLTLKDDFVDRKGEKVQYIEETIDNQKVYWMFPDSIKESAELYHLFVKVEENQPQKFKLDYNNAEIALEENKIENGLLKLIPHTVLGDLDDTNNYYDNNPNTKFRTFTNREHSRGIYSDLAVFNGMELRGLYPDESLNKNLPYNYGRYTPTLADLFMEEVQKEPYNSAFNDVIPPYKAVKLNQPLRSINLQDPDKGGLGLPGENNNYNRADFWNTADKKKNSVIVFKGITNNVALWEYRKYLQTPLTKINEDLGDANPTSDNSVIKWNNTSKKWEYYLLKKPILSINDNLNNSDPTIKDMILKWDNTDEKWKYYQLKDPILSINSSTSINGANPTKDKQILRWNSTNKRWEYVDHIVLNSPLTEINSSELAKQTSKGHILISKGGLNGLWEYFDLLGWIDNMEECCTKVLLDILELQRQQEEASKTFIVTWKYSDKSHLESVRNGEKAGWGDTNSALNTVRNYLDTKNLEFKEWSGFDYANTPVTLDGNEVIADTYLLYIVLWISEETTIKTLKVRKGSSISYSGTEPSKEGYLFKGWTPNPSETVINSNTNFTAIFEEITKPIYKVTWKDEENQLYIEDVLEGDYATYGNTYNPTETSTKEFIGWDYNFEVEPITLNITINTIWRETILSISTSKYSISKDGETVEITYKCEIREGGTSTYITSSQLLYLIGSKENILFETKSGSSKPLDDVIYNSSTKSFTLRIRIKEKTDTYSGVLKIKAKYQDLESEELTIILDTPASKKLQDFDYMIFNLEYGEGDLDVSLITQDTNITIPNTTYLLDTCPVGFVNYYGGPGNPTGLFKIKQNLTEVEDHYRALYTGYYTKYYEKLENSQYVLKSRYIYDNGEQGEEQTVSSTHTDHYKYYTYLYLVYAGDNTRANGVEEICINWKKIRDNFVRKDGQICVYIYIFPYWYRGEGEFTLNFSTYKAKNSSYYFDKFKGLYIFYPSDLNNRTMEEYVLDSNAGLKRIDKSTLISSLPAKPSGATTLVKLDVIKNVTDSMGHITGYELQTLNVGFTFSYNLLTGEQKLESGYLNYEVSGEDAEDFIWN